MLKAGVTCWRVETAPRAALLVDMEPYLEAARTVMASARRSIHFLNWAFDPDTILDHEPDGPETDPLCIGPFLRDLADTRPDLEIRILCWQSALPVAASQRFFPVRSRAFFAGSRVDFQLDGSLPLGASHHQKVVIVDDAIAFVGSCDIGPDRWDTPEHRHPDKRRAKTPGKAPCYDCRHEIMAMIDGPPAATLGELFRERWARATGEHLAAPAVAPAVPWPVDVRPDLVGATVGIARTQAPWKTFEERREGEAATLAAIASAKTLIYLENQYFTSPIVAHALALRLEEPEGPEVVLVSTQHSPSWFDQLTMDRTRSAFLRQLELTDRHGRLRAYSPLTQTGEAIIVHAKLAIIDDRYVRLGSSNMNNRSEGFDTECDLILDASTANEGGGPSCVSVFRDRLVAHWLGCDAAQVRDAIARQGGLGLAIDALGASGHRRLQPLRSRPLGALAGLVATFHLGDPISAQDSLRPWRRRAASRNKLAEATRRLEAARLPAPELQSSDGEGVGGI
jgi:phosphatidylserine/phosphatidylglycerophosphate/cardiolipin synthase-like enzyme